MSLYQVTFKDSLKFETLVVQVTDLDIKNQGIIERILGTKKRHQTLPMGEAIQKREQKDSRGDGERQ